MHELVVLQSLWSMRALKGVAVDHTIEHAADLIADAGFDGLGSVWTDPAEAKAVAAAARRRNLLIEGLCFPHDVESLRAPLQLAAEHGILHMNIQPDVRPRSVAECLPILEGWMGLSEKLGVKIFIETHRGRMTNDLNFTLELLREFPELELLADLSHYVVSAEIVLPVADEQNTAIQTILNHAGAFHGRVASSEQVQIELSYERNAPYIEQFQDWWTYGFRRWQERAPVDAKLSFLCELGTAPYAITDEHGVDRTDRWAESKLLRDMAVKAWALASNEVAARP